MPYIYSCIDLVEPISDTFGEQATNAYLYNVVSPDLGSCSLTYDASDLTVDLAAGNITHFGSNVAVAVAANAFTLVADTTFPRWTWLALSSAGAPVVVSGDPAATPSVPELGDRVAVALVYVQANLTIAFNAEQKLDKRVAGYHPTIVDVQYTMGDILPTAAQAAATGTGNTAYLVALPAIVAPTTITKLRINLDVSSGNLDVGIYSTTNGSDFTRVTSLGTTASPGTGDRTFDITDTVLYPGTRYWFAFAGSDGTISPYRYGTGPAISVSGIGRSKATSFPLPATISAASAANLTAVVAVLGLISGGSVA